MIYQVMTREAGSTAWHPYADATTDPFAVMRLIQLANQIAAEVTVVQADTEDALLAVLRDLSGGASVRTSSPVPSLTATPRVRVSDPPLDQRRWEVETGPGGDHDEPYAFVLPPDQEVLTSWLRLFARSWHAPNTADLAEQSAAPAEIDATRERPSES